MSKLLFPILIALTLFSCNKESSIDSHYLVKADSTLNIHVGTGVNPATNNMTYLEIDNKKLIAYANMNDLMFYDIKEKNIFHKIRFQQDGPNGIGNLKRFHVENLDSIFIFSYTHLILSDSSGHVYKRKDFSNLISQDIPIALVPLFYKLNNRVINSSNKLNMACYLMTENIPDIEKTTTGLIYDIQEDSFYLNNRYYPSNHRNYPNFLYSRDKGDSKYVYSFFLDNKLHQISKNGQHETFPCKSKFAPKLFTPSGGGKQ